MRTDAKIEDVDVDAEKRRLEAQIEDNTEES